MARTTKEEALVTRERILDAAEKTFHENGVSRTSLADVAERAGVTRGAIYWHFENKSDLFDAMCERMRLPMEEMAAAAKDERHEDPLGQLQKTCLFLLNKISQDPHFRNVLDIIYHKCEYVEAAGPIYERQKVLFMQARSNIERILCNAIAKGQLAPDLDTRLASIMFQAQVEGLINTWLLTRDTESLDLYAENMIDAAVNTLQSAHSLRRNAKGLIQKTSL
ncbi:TetR family transcriptional regulator [Noviherbaspirillum suwonense]|uniref:Transcriptional regulator, TetR family n=1 Tax=Noviherbaspirillum suwonense TaxID=1224511 RepID=A0ABY1QW78_9BURK|nr:TetR family transcriptional regulator [Noviherbaspirillum suwonense]SMP80951.1 transcriptional regulator, TetR family [Noviherbaspirillum suwonense]